MKNLRKSIQSFTLFAGLLFMSTPIFAQSTWKVDPAHAKVTFSTVHNTISDVEGLFNAFESDITASKEDFSDAVFTLSVDVNSIDTEIKMRDDHLRSADFFEVEKFPKMTFKSTSVDKTKEKNHYKLKGNLTMHGVTKAITMDLWYRGTITDAQSGNLIAGFQITGSLNRLDFGVGPKFPEALISNEVIIKADGEYIKQK
ncbi:YceI family protein [Gelidibacter japonicus]|uniref:YceI family protein n=1 Tax=Gelidibacter japonicus TaxID=1962232 RepID=UPI002AFE1660|nr:YceI family protein [Gelidibacter japonicus]